jgi:hypothetical protein
MEKEAKEVVVRFGRSSQKDPLKTSWYRFLQVVYGFGLVLVLIIVIAIAFDKKPYFNDYDYKKSIGEEIQRQYPNDVYDNYTAYTVGEKAVERGTDVVAKLREKNALFTPKSETVGSWFDVFTFSVVGLIITVVMFLGIRWVVKYIIVGK